METDPLTDAMVNKRDPTAAGEVNKPVKAAPSEANSKKSQGSNLKEQAPAGGARAEDVREVHDTSDILLVRRSVLGIDSSLE